jgi:hypothetical protein
VVHPFDAVQGFGYDKPAHEPCRHLQADFRCGIHATLTDQGFPGCVSFDCFGAGQHVTQQLFAGAHWEQSPAIASQMFDVYARVRALHELMAMLTLAVQHAGNDAQRQGLQACLDDLESLCANVASVPQQKALGQIKSQTLALISESVRP